MSIFFPDTIKEAAKRPALVFFLGARGEFGHILWSCQPNFHRKFVKNFIEQYSENFSWLFMCFKSPS